MPDKVPLTGLNFLIQRSLTFKQKTKFWFGFKIKKKIKNQVLVYI